MDVTGIKGVSFHKGAPAGEFILKGGRGIAANGRLTEHVDIQFLGPIPSDLGSALRVIEERKERLPEPLLVDLEFQDGIRQGDCEVASYWGGKLGERWFGIDLDLDHVPT
jgi:hypothetical protein